MSRYINPFTDFGFKKLFGEEANKDLLIDFINSLEIHKYKLSDVTFRKTEKLGNIAIDRKAFFDIYCTDEKGNRFIVELQKVEQKFFKDRALYYSTFAIQEQAERGEWDYQLTGVYFIGILDFELVGEKHKENKYKHEVMLVEVEEQNIFYDKLKYVYLEVPKFNKKENELETELDKWLYFLKYLSNLDTVPNVFSSEMFLKAFGIAEMINMDKESRLEYEGSLKSYLDLKVILDESFDKGKLEGLAEGMEKGKLEGLSEGEKLGIEKGTIKALKDKVIMLLSKKFSNLPDDIKLRINNCNDLTIFDNILESIFDIDSIDKLNDFF
jgi:predicted transposase/invertase (TIGR01784 family)